MRPASKTNVHITNGKSKEADASEEVQLEIKDISMVIPQRKKYTLCFNKTHLYAKLGEGRDVVAGTSFRWSDIGRSCILSCRYLQQTLVN